MKVGDLVWVKTHPDLMLALIVRIGRTEFARTVTSDSAFLYECRGLDGHNFSCLGTHLEVLSESR